MVITGARPFPWAGYLSAEEQQGNRVGEGGGQGRGRVIYAGATDGEPDAGPPTRSGITIGHERSAWLIASHDVSDCRFSIEGVIQRRHLPPGVTEDMAPTVLAQTANEKIRDRGWALGHNRLSLQRSKWFSCMPLQGKPRHARQTCKYCMLASLHA